MPVFANTPESRLGRSDSKDPLTTCRGITSSGRPCRRSLAEDDSPAAKARLKAKLRVKDPSDEALYCWQHKDQAALSTQSSPGPQSHNKPMLQGRSSIDTLAERLGLVRTHSAPANPGGPFSQSNPRKGKSFSCCFCFTIPLPDLDLDPPPRPKPTPIQQVVSTTPRPTGKPGRKKRRDDPASLIPAGTAPETTAKLVAELNKPFSEHDDPGYIYIFWLTPESQPATPPANVARTLLEPPSSSSRPSTSRKISDVLAAFGFDAFDDDRNETTDRAIGRSQNNKKILLKIGRATNVQRRLNEWNRQCGYNLSLIRYYPYVPSSAAPSSEPRKVPHSHKVERLVHLELDGLGMRVAEREKCEACGKEHKEWFEVDATKKAVEEVDDIIRRWSEWDETQA
ncbi:meiotically up-regulated gene 113-domain-containing protein [Cladorrhinum sp. PSN332]|nr:meiotically up-regulated gene 113-domain-containing protein [Cladorrhinum sp. PSN332]